MRFTHVIMLFAFAAAPAPASAAPGPTTGASPDTSEPLAATTAVPWNPPAQMQRRRGWEQTLLMPGRVLSLPLAAVGQLTSAALLWGEENGRIPGTVDPGASHAASTGLSIKPPGLGGGGGLGAAVEFKRPVSSGRTRMLLAARYAGTLRNYNGTRITATGKPLTVQYGYDWRPEERFFGVGTTSSSLAMSDYAVQSEFVRASLGREWRPENGGKLERTSATLWAETRNQVVSRGRKPDQPSFEALFPDVAAPILGRRVEHLVYGVSLDVDRRAGIPHWGRGFRASVSAERHDAPVHALAIRVGSPAGAQFNRLRLETETGFSFDHDPRTVRLMARVVDQSIGAGAERMLPSDLATLGGNAGLGGFARGRFHDNDLLLTRVSYIFPVTRRLELDVHSEYGAVYHDVWQDATLGTLQPSYGLALRGRYQIGVLASFGIDFSRDGARISYALGSVQ